jgi:hypothetical protein
MRLITSSVEGAGYRPTPTCLAFFSPSPAHPLSQNLEISLLFTLETSHFRLVILAIPAQVKSLYVYFQYLPTLQRQTNPSCISYRILRLSTLGNISETPAFVYHGITYHLRSVRLRRQ